MSTKKKVWRSITRKQGPIETYGTPVRLRTDILLNYFRTGTELSNTFACSCPKFGYFSEQYFRFWKPEFTIPLLSFQRLVYVGARAAAP